MLYIVEQVGSHCLIIGQLAGQLVNLFVTSKLFFLNISAIRKKYSIVIDHSCVNH